MRCLLVTLGLLVALCALLARAHPAPSDDPDNNNQNKNNNNLQRTPDPVNLPPDTFRKLAQALYARGEKKENRLQRKFLYNPNVTCNDGSTAGYYMRRNYNSKRWIVFLEGGWICHDAQSCSDRSAREHHRVSSDRWPSNRTVGGILSADPDENPHFADANHVFVPYCSSDSWSGTRRGSKRSPAFLGSVILREVIRELADYERLLFADELFLAGSSAGGTGVLVNVDAVADMLASSGVRVRGVVDSGWFLDNDPFSTECQEGLGKCSVIQNLKKGVELWKAHVPRPCHVAFPGEIWKCFLGYRIFPLIKTPLFIFQWQFDKFQLYADNVAVPASRDQWNYIHRMGKNLRGTLSNASFVFSPACIAHEVLTSHHWTEISVSDVTLPDAMHCWAQSLLAADAGVNEGGRRKLPAGSGSLEVRAQVIESYVPRDSNDVLVPVEMHSRTASMLSDSPHSYKLLARNLIRSIPTPRKAAIADDKARNSINNHLETRRNHRKLDDVDNDDEGDNNNHNQNHRRRHQQEENRRRRRRLQRRKNQLRCQTESNTCHDNTDANLTKEDEDRSDASVRNIDLVRSLDRRSNRKKKQQKDRKLRKKGDEAKQNADRPKSEKEVAREARRAERRRQKQLRKKRLRAQRREERRRMRELEKTKQEAKSDGGDADAVEKGQSEHHHHLKVRSADLVTSQQSAASQSVPSSSSSSSSSSLQSSSSAPSQSAKGPKCPSRSKQLIDTCSWPHCNPSCPKLKNPETGQEIDFLTLLKSFGLDMGSVASALGVDIATLDSMDRADLLHILTSQNQN